ncbi:MAG TPA: hypothetical protein VKK79_01905 [Candidatus Lokiarchaeia archaeon]|nr:hypothetical protein [Candidatus Lokiarchaeia archaeon]
MVETEGTQKFIFDCNVWIHLILQGQSSFFQQLELNNYQIILTSYNAVEILRVLKRISKRTNVPFERLENLAWNSWKFPCIHPIFDKPMSDAIINEVRILPEYAIIAKAFDLEQKDVPYVIAVFQYDAVLVTKDQRSLVSRAEILQEKLGIRIITWDSFLELLQTD